MEIFEMSERPDQLETAIQYFWKCWGNESNHIFYHDCIMNSIDENNKLPKFYIAMEGEEIIGSYALLTNDIVSRQDLMPWFACLYVNEPHRNKGLGGQLLNHGIEQTKEKGFENLYLSTDLVNFYEKKGWQEYGKGYGVFGDEFKVYTKSTGL